MQTVRTLLIGATAAVTLACGSDYGTSPERPRPRAS